MNAVSIHTENLGKLYRRGGRKPYRTLREALTSAVTIPLRRGNPGGRRTGMPDAGGDEFWALHGVGFDLHAGETLGIIGPNGAGKSTLLKLLSRITSPSSGWAEIRGRVGSLLEVGTGFHPELTGRENIYLSGAILGMRKNDIRRRFDQIVDFSGCANFLDMPIKRYSSGMYMRLAFAVAAHLESDILLVDEVLAVGDAEFQKKCFERMGSVVREGRTILFVSHNMLAVQKLCDRVILLQNGEITARGEPAEVVSRYLKSSRASSRELSYDNITSAPGNEAVRVRAARVITDPPSTTRPIDVRSSFVLEFEFWNLQSDAPLDVSLEVHNQEGILVFCSGTTRSCQLPRGLIRTACRIPGDLLNCGTYQAEFEVVRAQGSRVYRWPEALIFDVLDSVELRGAWYGEWPGAVRPNLEWRTEIIDTSDRGLTSGDEFARSRAV
jgi:lipopolysaccharide transport system ATP-binding protein